MPVADKGAGAADDALASDAKAPGGIEGTGR
jgi:hypothetical protein